MTTSTEDDRRPLPAEPERNVDERTTLEQFLDYFRVVLIRKLEGVDDAGRNQRLGPSTLTLGALVKHMAFVEDIWFAHRFAGRPDVEPWGSAPWDDEPDWELVTAAHDTHEQLIDLFETAVDRSRAVLAEVESLDEIAASPGPDGEPVSMRWILVHMIEEYARHCGHADLLREAVDGVVGD